MKTLEEIFESGRKPEDIIKDLKYYKENILKLTDWAELEKEYEPKLHKIMTDKLSYPDKAIKDEKGSIVRYEPVTRVAIGLQKLAAKRMSEFMFTIPVESVAEDTDDQTMKDQMAAIKKVLKKNKWNSTNKKRCKIVSSECEQATYWYVVESKNKSYGFESKYKLKHAVFSPKNGDSLYPTFDDMGDMIAFSREYQLSDGKSKVFECWTADNYYKFTSGDSGWVAENPVKISIGKIPVVYSYRPEPIWRDADSGKVHEIEVLMSRNGDTIAYHSAPVLLIKGKMTGAPTKGESNKVFFTEDGNGDAKYVSWTQAPEAVKFQFDTLLRTFFMELQLPDLSFENIKGIGAQSGESRKWLMVDAHLKVGDESEIYEDMIEREYNVIKAYLGEMNTSWKNTIQDLEIEPQITPFTIDDEKTYIEMLIEANGGKPLVSHKQSVKLANLADNTDDDYAQILSEEGAIEDNTI